jgi:hypothetical protein
MTLVRSIIGCWPESALESSLAIRCGKSLLPIRAAVLAADETREQSAHCSFTVFRCRRAQLVASRAALANRLSHTPWPHGGVTARYLTNNRS